MRRALVLLVLAALPAGAATIEERSVDIRLTDGAAVETLRTVYLLEEVGDLAAFSEYAITLDEHIELLDLAAAVLGPDGTVVERIPRRRCREITSAGSELHTSTRVLVIPFPKLDLGQRVEIRVVRERRPYFPAHQVYLQTDEPQRSVEVRVHGAGPGFRWQAQRTDGFFEVRELPDGFVVTGHDVPRLVGRDHAADADSGEPLVRFAWGSEASWPEVGAWYARLTAGVPRGAEAVRRVAREVAGGVDDPHERLRRLMRRVQETIRYEAVEVGVGGWVPTPAHETLARGWGDCKDMSELLAELLRAVDVPAHLALVRLGQDGRVAADFPSHLQFNHCVVAVPAAAVGGAGEEYLFLDPTMKDGSPTWLNPAIQGQLALVEAGASSRAVTVPSRPDAEGRILNVVGSIDAEGGFTGVAAYRVVGLRALGWITDLSTEPPEEIEAAARRTMEYRFSGARVGRVLWAEIEGDVPTFQIDAELNMPHFATGEPARLRLRPVMLSALPEPRELDDRDEPVVLTPGVHASRWVIGLPDGACLPDTDEAETAGGGARLHEVVARDEEGRLVLERTLRVEQAFLEPEELDELRAVAVEQVRSDRRSLRLTCPTD